MANLLPTIALSHPFKRSVMKSRTRPVNLDVCMKLTLNPHSQNRRCGTQKRLRIHPLCHLLGFGSRMAIRSSERRRAEEKNSRATLVPAVSSKPGPLQTKGSGTLRPLPGFTCVPPAQTRLRRTKCAKGSCSRELSSTGQRRRRRRLFGRNRHVDYRFLTCNEGVMLTAKNNAIAVLDLAFIREHARIASGDKRIIQEVTRQHFVRKWIEAAHPFIGACAGFVVFAMRCDRAEDIFHGSELSIFEM